MISITDTELDDLELRCKLLARAGDATAHTRFLAAQLAVALRSLSFALAEDIHCKGTPATLRCDEWQAADAVGPTRGNRKRTG